MFKKLIFGILLATGIASAALVDTDRALVDQVKNILENPGFENGKARWTASGGTFTVSSTGKAFGAAGALFDASSASQTLTSTAVAIPEGLKAKNAVVSCSFKTVSGLATHKLQAYDGTNVVAESVIASSTASFLRTSVNFIAPSSGNLSARIISVAADEPQIYVDDCVVGLADGFNISSVSQATLVGTMTMSACNNQWDKNPMGSSYAAFANTSTCTYTKTGSIDTVSGATLPKITYTNAPPGEYLLLVEGYAVLVGTITANSVTSIGVLDGSTAYGEVGMLASAGTNNAISGTNLIQAHRSVSVPTTLTFELQGKYVSGAAGARIDATSSGVPLRFSLYRFPTTSETAYRSDQSDTPWTSYALTIGGTTTAPTPGTNTQLAQWRRIGDSMEIMYFIAQTGAGSAGSGDYLFPLPSGYLIDTNKVTVTTNGAGVAGSILGHGYIANTTATNTTTAREAHIAAYNTSNLRIIANDGGAMVAVGSSLLAMSASTINYAFRAVVPISGWTGSVRAPMLVGSVTSNSTGAERVERASFALTGASTVSINSQSGIWISSVSASSTRVTANITAGTFSAAPTCTVTCNSNVATVAPTFQAAPTTSALVFECDSIGASPAASQSNPINVVCMGPR